MLRQQLPYIILFIALAVFNLGIAIFQLHHTDQWTTLYYFFIPAGLLFLVALLYNQWRNYARVGEDGLTVSNFRHSYTVDFEEIRGVKIQPLSVAFPDPRKVAQAHRSLLKSQALYVRVKPDDEDELVSKLGNRLYRDGAIVLPVKDPEALALEINTRLPIRLSANQGGSKRRKRKH